MIRAGPGKEARSGAPALVAQRLLQVLSISWRGGQPSLYLPKARLPSIMKFGMEQKARSSEFMADTECCKNDGLQHSATPYAGPCSSKFAMPPQLPGTKQMFHGNDQLSDGDDYSRVAGALEARAPSASVSVERRHRSGCRSHDLCMYEGWF